MSPSQTTTHLLLTVIRTKFRTPPPGSGGKIEKNLTLINNCTYLENSLENGNLYGWGSNFYGELNDLEKSSEPQRIDQGDILGLAKCEVINYLSILLTQSGKLYFMGGKKNPENTTGRKSSRGYIFQAMPPYDEYHYSQVQVNERVVALQTQKNEIVLINLHDFRAQRLSEFRDMSSYGLCKNKLQIVSGPELIEIDLDHPGKPAENQKKAHPQQAQSMRFVSRGSSKLFCLGVRSKAEAASVFTGSSPAKQPQEKAYLLTETNLNANKKSHIFENSSKISLQTETPYTA